MLSQHDIATLYWGLLHREPDGAAVTWMRATFPSPAEATRYLLDSAEFTRREQQLPTRAPRPDEAVARALALHQLKHWMPAGCDMAAAQTVFERSPAPSRFILDLDEGRVAVRPRPVIAPHPRDEGFGARAHHYAKLIADVCQASGITDRTTFFFDMHDVITDTYYMPVCSYQRTPRQTTICFPDIEFLTNDFYEENGPVHDSRLFLDKETKASFIGSSTGYPYLLGTHNLLASPRIRSALFFKDYRQVEFSISSLVQTDGIDTDNAISALGIATPPKDFSSLYDSKFIISMDGNGATCSRVAMALRSNSVLLKYDSDTELFYFPMLVPWLHYIPVKNDADVLRIISHEEKNPGAFAHIAEASTTFYNDHLSRQAVFQYTATLIKAYSQIF